MVLNTQILSASEKKTILNLFFMEKRFSDKLTVMFTNQLITILFTDQSESLKHEVDVVVGLHIKLKKNKIVRLKMSM